MHIQITETMFIEAFREMDRMDNFSIEGLRALYNHIEEMEESTGQDIECDVIAICCDFNEISWDDVYESYSYLIPHMDAEDNRNEMLLEMLNEETMVIHYDDDKVLFQVF